MRRGPMFALAGTALALALVSGCSTTSQGRDPSTATPTRTATLSPTNTRTATPLATNTPVGTPTPVSCPVTCSPNWSWFTGLTQAGSTSIYPQTTPQTSGPVTLAGNDFWQFDFCAQSGVTYWFSACQYGGSYASDSVFELFDQACAALTMDDDTCSYGSEITWVSTFTGPATLGVAEYSNGPETVVLAYWTQ